MALRSPFLPFDTLANWGHGLRAAHAPNDAALWERDCRLARRRLRDLLDDPAIREALFLASPSLEERMSTWREDSEGEAGSIEVRLVKYLERMAARCTPFGLFAGNSVGRLGRETRLELLDRSAAVRHTRLDMDFLSEVVARVTADPDVRSGLTFSTNSSLYEVGGTLRYAEARVRDGRRAYFLVDVEPHDHLRRALVCARGGATPDVIAHAIEDDEVSFDTARSFVDALVDAQLLVADLGPVVTGPETLDDLIARLEGIEPAAAALDLLKRTRDALIDMDVEGLGVAPARYREMATSVASLAPVEISHFVQVDLTKAAADVVIAADLVDELLRGVQVLLDLFGRGRRETLEAFRRAFEDRYGDREMPLMEVLDEEIGIGFDVAHGPGADPSPLLAGLPFPPAEEEETATWGSRARFLEWKVAEAVASGAEEIVLDPAELAVFHDESTSRVADSFHILATLLAPDAASASAPRAILESVAGPSGVRLLGRFCHGDPDLRRHVEGHLRAEEALRPDVTYFEVVHLPEGRTGNILARPLLRAYELAFLGASGATRARTLHVDDLTVRLEPNQVMLRSRSLGREVRPRLTTAHNTAWRSLGIYRFLSALQAEGVVEGIMWMWGPLESQPRLPRVRLGRLILSRQQWSARREEVEKLKKKTGHDAFRAVQAWRVAHDVPRWVGLVEADNVLPVDLDNPLSVAAFLDQVRRREEFTLQELFPGGRTDAVHAPEGTFLNEVVVPVVRRAQEPVAIVPSPGTASTKAAPPAAPVSSTDIASIASPPISRDEIGVDGHDPARPHVDVFPPGSAWLAVKLYAGPALVDRALLDVVAPVVDAARASGAIERWFFVRYGDPDWHLRVRFAGDPARLIGEVLPALHHATEPWLRDRRLHRIQLDTYVRETRRYGGERGVVLCEDFFFHDSCAVLALLAEATGDAGLDARWRFAFLGFDRLLDDLGFDLAEKHALVRALAKGYGTEFRMDAKLREQLRNRFRTERPVLDELLEERGPAAETISFALPFLRTRSERIRDACAEFRGLPSRGEITSSLLHMHANRVLRSSHRAQEMVLHYYLEKTYASRLARARTAAEVDA